MPSGHSSSSHSSSSSGSSSGGSHSGSSGGFSSGGGGGHSHHNDSLYHDSHSISRLTYRVSFGLSELPLYSALSCLK